MTNTNTVNIHIFLHIASSVNQNQHYCAIVHWKSMVMFMTAGPGNPLLVLEGCQNVQKEIWTKEQQQQKKRSQMWLNGMKLIDVCWKKENFSF